MMTIMAFACALLIEPIGGIKSLEEDRGSRGMVRASQKPRPPCDAHAALPPKPAKAAKSPEELQAALNRIGQSDTRGQSRMFPLRHRRLSEAAKSPRGVASCPESNPQDDHADIPID